MVFKEIIKRCLEIGAYLGIPTAMTTAITIRLIPSMKGAYSWAMRLKENGDLKSLTVFTFYVVQVCALVWPLYILINILYHSCQLSKK